MSDFSTGPKDFSSTVSISHYVTDPFSSDYRTRALVFGNESAKIYGKMVVNSNGSKVFQGIEIRPRDTDFNFEPKNGGRLLEIARAKAKEIYDPYSQGVSYDIPFRGNGRTYEPFTDSQLNAALRREFFSPSTALPGLLPSTTDPTPRFLKNYLEYLDQVNGKSLLTPGDGTAEISSGKPAPRLSPWYGNNAPSSVVESKVPAAPIAASGNLNSFGSLAEWVASLAGVDPQSPRQAAAPPLDYKLRDFYRDDPAWFLQGRR